jgi:hypothetical protein
MSTNLSEAQKNTGRNTGTPLQYEVSSLSLGMATKGTLV